MSNTAENNEFKWTRALLTAAVVLLLGLLVVLLVTFYKLLEPKRFEPVASESTEMVWVRSMYGFGASADEQLRSPSSVAIAPNGDIYATDPTRARVMVFSPDGEFRRLLHTGAGGTDEGQFIRPESIDVDSNGDVYIADSWAGKIIVFDSVGEYVREWSVDDRTRGVAVVDGQVYVLGAGTVHVFDTEGRPVTSFGSRGAMPGQIDAYQGVIARGEEIFIADSLNKRIQSFSATGALRWTAPDGAAPRTGPSRDTTVSATSGGYRWDLPQDLVFDGRGRLIVVDAFRFEIAVVDPDSGSVTASYGEFGRYDGQFFYPTSIAYDPQRDWFAVADTQNHRVQIVRIPGSGSAVTAPLWRAASSPYRYLLWPALMLAAAIALAWWMARRVMRETADVEPDGEILASET